MSDPKFAALIGDLALDGGTLALLLLTVFPVALLAGALMIVIASFARSFKEAKSYLTPLLLLVILPSLLGGLPGMEITPALALIPIFNASQLLNPARRVHVGQFPRHLRGQPHLRGHLLLLCRQHLQERERHVPDVRERRTASSVNRASRRKPP